MDIFFYKMTNDSGAAPCVQSGLLSLAICKPMIRTSAKVGDLVFGFAANSLRKDNPLVYVARVTQIVRGGCYYEDPRYTDRADCIYERVGEQFKRRPDARFHADPRHLRHDLGSPTQYPRATVLLSRDFRYFGGAGTADYKRKYPRLRRELEELKRGHRRYHSAPLEQELLALEKEVWSNNPARRIGAPMSPPDPDARHNGGSCGKLTCAPRKPSHRQPAC